MDGKCWKTSNGIGGFLWDLKLIYGIAKLGNMGNQVGCHITPITN
jgi:hypothetical protein